MQLHASSTPAFASPEQFAVTASDPERVADTVPSEEGALDVRSDIFSLGVTLWYLLTGSVPFVGRTLAEIHERQTRHPLPVEQLAKAAVPASVAALLRSLLAPDPAARPQNARQLAAALRDCQQKLAFPDKRRVWLFGGAAVATLGRALAATAATRFRMALHGQYWPRALLEADLARLRGDPDSARPALLAARPATETAARATPEDPAALMTLAALDARLGRRDDALAEGRRAPALAGPARDGYEGAIFTDQFARVLTLLGERDAALDLLRENSRAPNSTSYGNLRRSPDWDPLRGDPRFEALCQQLAPPAK